jgi:hypothetical protein
MKADLAKARETSNRRVILLRQLFFHVARMYPVSAELMKKIEEEVKP